ncbi:aspartyl/asparaginyl beta-hydroxylase domain-containing protein [Undibacterium sp. TS12]|uniref:aspartyl/asparaginyl beta-hydroxylase domain-containing protein n=1 Tax=Undibacterium sp. TS12 TaxID=2908202 RepID=UPI001F4CD7FD|nr:aspartyl/asparaginyl beta-hydroxylase domain-containing protein [Undibacterium sp. TS12]MCH8622632.1 aspartyl/asparaginyl beta-hydroxylase domain-containing protein [Undibacterium sp. TS12]
MSRNFLKIAQDINVQPLQMALIRQPELFGNRTSRSDAYASPHQQMTDIWVRYNAYENLKRDPEKFNDEHDSVWYPEATALPQVRPIVSWLMSHVEGERLGGVLITKIPPGGKIAPHVDMGWHAKYYEKYYIPVQNDQGALFCFEDGIIEPQPGDVYWFNNSRPHWVENHSQRDRIALIVCIRSHKASQEVLCHGQQ